MASRAESCRICAIILRMVIEEWGWSSKDYNSMSLEERITAIPWHMIWIELPKAFGLYKNISISLGTVIHPTTYWLELNLVKTFDSTITSPLSNVVFPETLHLNTLHRMLSWLDKCNTSHSGCSHLSTRLVPLPTRVLDVSALPGQNQMLGRYRSWQELFQGRNCKLFQSTNGQTGRYAALSYCWGAELPLKTTRANLKAHKFAIGFDTLPRTLQDAVMIVRWMGIEFIWIDCLCILQDSKKDWEYEAARMADVYSNAYLTVAASRAAHCREGFLGLRRRNCPVSVKIEDEAGLFELYFQKPSKKAIESEALNSRGWAMQEGILSHRVLSFNESQMTWACAQDEVTEEVLEIWGQLYHAKQLILIAESLSRLEPGEFRTSYWAHFVQSYSARKVTYKTDTFPAISGVVRKIQQLTGDIYYAGLWKQHFLIGLLWSPKTTLRPVNYFSMEEPSGRLKSRQQWVAPSWSWASIEGAIEYQPISTGDSEYCARLEECRITYSGLDPLGALTTGFARLTGPVVSIRRTGGSRQEIQLRNGKLASATVEFDSVDYQSCRALMITPHQGICIKKIGQNTVTFSAKLDKLLWPALWLSKKAMPSVVANAYSRVGIVNVQSFDLGKSLTARDHVKPRSIVLI